MAIIDQINKINCDGNGVLGTGLAGCRADRKRVVAFGLLAKGTEITANIDKVSMRALQVSGKLIMLQGVVTFADNTPEDTIITRDGSGIKKVVGKMPYEYMATFDNGFNFQKALVSLSSYEAYDIIFFDVDNQIWLTQTKSGKVKGFSLGMFESGKYTGSNGTDAASQTITFQLLNRIEVDLYQVVVTNDQLDFIYSELTGINQTVLKVDPATAGTSLVVSVFLQDGTHSVEGLAFGDFKVLKNGIPSNPTALTYNAVTKKYTLTVPALVAADVLQVSLNGNVLTIVDVLYKSNVVNVIVS